MNVKCNKCQKEFDVDDNLKWTLWKCIFCWNEFEFNEYEEEIELIDFTELEVDESHLENKDDSLKSFDDNEKMEDFVIDLWDDIYEKKDDLEKNNKKEELSLSDEDLSLSDLFSDNKLELSEEEAKKTEEIEKQKEEAKKKKEEKEQKLKTGWELNIDKLELSEGEAKKSEEIEKQKEEAKKIEEKKELKEVIKKKEEKELSKEVKKEETKKEESNKITNQKKNSNNNLKNKDKNNKRENKNNASKLIKASVTNIFYNIYLVLWTSSLVLILFILFNLFSTGLFDFFRSYNLINTDNINQSFLSNFLLTDISIYLIYLVSLLSISYFIIIIFSVFLKKIFIKIWMYFSILFFILSIIFLVFSLIWSLWLWFIIFWLLFWFTFSISILSANKIIKKLDKIESLIDNGKNIKIKSIYKIIFPISIIVSLFFIVFTSLFSLDLNLNSIDKKDILSLESDIKENTYPEFISFIDKVDGFNFEKYDDILNWVDCILLNKTCYSYYGSNEFNEVNEEINKFVDRINFYWCKEWKWIKDCINKNISDKKERLKVYAQYKTKYLKSKLKKNKLIKSKNKIFYNFDLVNDDMLKEIEDLYIVYKDLSEKWVFIQDDEELIALDNIWKFNKLLLYFAIYDKVILDDKKSSVDKVINIFNFSFNISSSYTSDKMFFDWISLWEESYDFLNIFIENKVINLSIVDLSSIINLLNNIDYKEIYNNKLKYKYSKLDLLTNINHDVYYLYSYKETKDILDNKFVYFLETSENKHFCDSSSNYNIFWRELVCDYKFIDNFPKLESLINKKKETLDLLSLDL